jgi:hypothetical protein
MADMIYSLFLILPQASQSLSQLRSFDACSFIFADEHDAHQANGWNLDEAIRAAKVPRN